MVRLFVLLIPLLSTLPPSAAQSSSSSSEQALIASLPDCALKCLITIGSGSICGLDTTCLCTNGDVQSEITGCVQSSCTVKQSLAAKNITSSLCHDPVYDKSQLTEYVSIIMGVLCVAFWLVRVAVSRFMSPMPWNLDDCFVMLSALGSIPSTVISTLAVKNGLGRDIWTLSSDQITNFGMYFYILAILYFAQLCLLKMSLLFFYLRIFPKKSVRTLLWATIAFNAGFGIAFCVAAIFQCRPINFFWTKWDGEHTGTCASVNAITWSNAAINITLDFCVLSIPLSQLSSLKMHWKKKVGVGFMFAIGAFVTIVSIIRLQSLIRFGDSENPTHDEVDVTTWSTIEVSVGIICLCLPQIRLILVRLFPRVFGSTENRSYVRYGPSYDKSSTIGEKRKRSLYSSQQPETEFGDNDIELLYKSGIVHQQTYSVEYGPNHGTRRDDASRPDHEASISGASASKVSM